MVSQVQGTVLNAASVAVTEAKSTGKLKRKKGIECGFDSCDKRVISLAAQVVSRSCCNKVFCDRHRNKPAHDCKVVTAETERKRMRKSNQSKDRRFISPGRGGGNNTAY